MSVINEKNKRYIERFANPQFTDCDFVGYFYHYYVKSVKGINEMK